MTPIATRIQTLLGELNQGVYEKDRELAFALWAALAGQSIILLGPPGVAKSMVGRRLKCAFAHAQAFEYLMSRFSTPDEIFGPVSIARLKTDDSYERTVEGYLPTADVVFLDEIWKAGPAIQNSLLTVLNEKLFRNGRTEMQLPLKLLIAASNELPAQGEGLEALWDRFLIRLMCQCVQQPASFFAMVTDGAAAPAQVSEPITPQEYAEWQQQIAQVAVPQAVLECLYYIRQHISTVEAVDGEVHRSIYISDRRWKHIVQLLRTAAWMQGRNEVHLCDVLPTAHCLWDEPSDLDDVRRLVVRGVCHDFERRLENLSNALSDDLKQTNVATAARRAQANDDHRDDGLRVVDDYYYHVLGHGVGETYIFVVDYRQMHEYNRFRVPQQGIVYPDFKHKGRTLIRTYSDPKDLTLPGARRMPVYRDAEHLYLDGVKYALERLPEGETQTAAPKQRRALSGRDYEGEVEQLLMDTAALERELNSHLLTGADDRKAVAEALAALRKQIAVVRVDIRKLLYD